MAKKSFGSKVLFFVVIAGIVFLWQFERNYSTLKVTLTLPRYGNINREMRNSNTTEPCLILYWSTIFGSQPHIEKRWNDNDCPVVCQVTSDRSRAREADGFVVHARDSHMTPPKESVPWILHTQENPVYTSVMKNAKFMSRFNLLMSYRLDYDFPVPVYPMPQLTPPLTFKEKTKLIMAAFSNCEPVRTEYMRQLMKFVQVDSYGACLRNKNDLVSRYGSKNGKNFKELKSELARQYKFTLVFFNQDCEYFVDDQLSHALNAGSVPVVMSTDKLDEFLPGNLRQSVIKVRDFRTPKDLSDYLKYLSTNETEYNNYLTWKSKGVGNITGTVIGNFWKPKYPIYCQICVALSEGRIHKEGLRPIPCNARTYEDWGIKKGA
ncbi:alpha-(1,3)-fucosyltransferase 11-like [Pocillopora damicornis]|nr:alpha-(1,3)-fucosyltransferase 11-like [Pocillopora damicornis]XP_027060251.1 alpha-(1,3)-fucosyltransferase 11-like [Pocillopora damicornis]